MYVWCTSPIYICYEVANSYDLTSTKFRKNLYETIIVNEAQVPPTGLLCEVQAGEMVTWKDIDDHFW